MREEYAMVDKILFVDDDPKILEAFRRELGKKYSIVTALSGDKALETIKQNEPIAVIIADIRMPDMDGIRFLTKAMAISPDSVRMVLTGTADMQTAIHAVNQGQIFRFMTKPCPDVILRSALDAGIKQYHLIIAEKELLEKTLVGSIKVISEVLSLISPTTFSKATRLRRTVVHVVAKLGLEEAWRFELATALSQIGLIVFPPNILDKINARTTLTPSEKSTFLKHPIVGGELIKNIPRLELIASMIRDQELDLEELKMNERSGDDYIAGLGAHLIKTAIDYDDLILRGHSHEDALRKLSGMSGKYQPDVLIAMIDLQPKNLDDQIQTLDISFLDVGMIVMEDIVNYEGQLVVAKNQEVTYPLLMKLFKLDEGKRITKKTTKVLITK